MSIRLILYAMVLAAMQLGLIESVKIDHVALKVMSVPSKIIQNLKVFNATNKNGDRTFSVQFIVTADLPTNLVVTIKPYFDRKKKLVPAPIKLAPNICDAFEKNTMKLRTIFTHSNLTECPIKAGTYKIWNWAPEDSEIPALPPGRYQADLTFVADNEELATVRWIGGILK